MRVILNNPYKHSSITHTLIAIRPNQNANRCQTPKAWRYQDVPQAWPPPRTERVYQCFDVIWEFVPNWNDLFYLNVRWIGIDNRIISRVGVPHNGMLPWEFYGFLCFSVTIGYCNLLRILLLFFWWTSILSGWCWTFHPIPHLRCHSNSANSFLSLLLVCLLHILKVLLLTVLFTNYTFNLLTSIVKFWITSTPILERLVQVACK